MTFRYYWIEAFRPSIVANVTFYLDAELISLYSPFLDYYYDHIGVSLCLSTCLVYLDTLTFVSVKMTTAIATLALARTARDKKLCSNIK